MSEFEDSMTYQLWLCAAFAQDARNAVTESHRQWATEQAAKAADKAWARYWEQYPAPAERGAA